MNNCSITLVGASGLAGMELTTLLAHHPWAELRNVVSASHAGERVAVNLPGIGSAATLLYQPMDAALTLAAQSDVTLLASSVDVSLNLVPAILQRGGRVIDLSGAFRLQDANAFAEAYGRPHPAEHCLPDAVYGLPELHGAALPQARLVANPGCYPTAAILALAPLFEAQLITDDAIVVHGASGTSGAGRVPHPELQIDEMANNHRAYRPLEHQHTPEMMQVLQQFAGACIAVTFVPHLLPVQRGMLVSAYARLANQRSSADVHAVWRQKYASHPNIHIRTSANDVQLTAVVGTNRLRLAAFCDSRGYDPGRLVVLAAIDNLLKGAAGQAVQNLNMMMGWPIDVGIDANTGA